MIKNYIHYYKNINPINLIDFSISEEYVFNELKKYKDEEIIANISTLLKNAIYFEYKQLYLFLKQKAEKEIYTKNSFIKKALQETNQLEKYVFKN